MSLFEPPCGEPLDYFVVADEGGSALTCDHLDVSNMVEVTMGEKDVVGVSDAISMKEARGLGVIKGSMRRVFPPV